MNEIHAEDIVAQIRRMADLIACQEQENDRLEQRLATQKKAIDALHEFAQSVAGGSSWWDDVWPNIEKELEAARPEVKGDELLAQ